MKNIKIYFVLASILFVNFIFAQKTEDKIIAALDSFALANPQEKCYIQTDKNSYLAGETIWFKAYTTLFEKPGILSKVLYVSFTNSKGKVVSKRKLKLENGSTNAEIEIKENLPAGVYYLSAYTLWMLNFPEFIFSKKITVVNSANTVTASAAAVEKKIVAGFFPEGGQLIAGIENNVAFKVIDQYNEPMTVTGKIVDDKNKTVANIKTIHNGMGKFLFIPADGVTYNAILKTVNDETITAPLPPVQSEGIVMHTDNSSNSKIFIKTERTEKNKMTYNDLIIVAQQNYEVVYMGRLNIEEGMDAVAINKKNLKPGIVQITIMNNAGVPLAERLVFIANYNNANDKVTGIALNGKRDKNTISLDAAGYDDLAAAVSVINADGDVAVGEQNILSALLLTSDIKGHVHNPSYYFINKDSSTLQNIDLVMLTNGWRRYLWADVLQHKYPTLHYPFETGLSITGKVLQSNGKSILKSGRINFVIKGDDSTTIMSQAKVNEQSVFMVNNIDFKKSATVYYQGTNGQREEAIVAVKLDPDYYDTLQKIKPEPASQQSIEAGNLLYHLLVKKETADKTKLLETVVVKTKKVSQIDSLDNVYASDIFQNGDQTLVVDGHYLSIWQYLQRVVPGIKINRNNGFTQVNFDRYDGLRFFNQTENETGVQFFLNEVSVSVDIVDGLDPDDVALIKVYKGVSGIALGLDKGGIALYTKKGKSTRDWRSKGFDFFKKPGYASSRAFYEMDYSKVKPDDGFTDVRTTLYWNPSLKIVNGKANIEFYNDDITQKFKIVVEGIDKNGKLLQLEKVF